MSLFDSLLLDEYRDANEVWATPRADGSRGAGSATDPYDTGEVAEASKAVGAIVFSATDLLCITQDEHGYSTGNIVSIENVLGQNAATFNLINVAVIKLSNRALLLPLGSVPTAGISSMSRPEIVKAGVRKAAHLFWPVAKVTLASSGFNDFDAVSIQGCTPSYFNGGFEIVGLATDGDSFYCRLGTTAQLPASATASVLGTCFRYRYRFDDIMRALPEESLLRVGAILGGAPIKSRGSANLYLEHNNTDSKVGFEVQTRQRVVGSGIDATTFKLVHVMSSYTPTTLFGRTLPNVYELAYWEAMDFTADCDIAGQAVPYQGVDGNNQPYAGFAPVATGAAGPLRGKHNRLRRLRATRFGTQCAPECFVLSLHGRFNLTSANNVVSDCVTEDPGINNFHESTLIQSNASGIGYPSNDANQFIVDGKAAVVRNCYCNSYYTNAGFLGQGASSAPVKVTAISRVGTSEIFTITTGEPHNRVAGNCFNISRVIRTDTGDAHPVYNGSFLVTKRNSETQLEIRIPNAPVSIPTPGLTNANSGADWHGPGPFGGSSGYVTEGNAAYDCRFPMYADTASNHGEVYRNNYFSGSLYSANLNLAPGRGFTGNPISAVSRPDSTNQPKLVRVTCPNDTFMKYLKEGDVAFLAFINEQGQDPGTGAYVGHFTVTNVTIANKMFDYETKITPAGDPSLGSAPSFFYVWRWSWIVFENNILDNWARTIQSYHVARGVLGAPADDSATGPNVILPDWVIRENGFRYIDGVPAPVADAQAVVLANTEGAIVDSNRMDMSGSPLIEFKRVRSDRTVIGFDNRTQSGAWLESWFTPTGKYLEDIVSRIEDVTSVCI